MDTYTWNREYEETDYGCVSAEYLNMLLDRRGKLHMHKMSCGHETCPHKEWPCKEVCLDCFAKSLGPLRKEKQEKKKRHKNVNSLKFNFYFFFS